MKKPVIEIQSVSKSFKDINAVNDLTLTIYEGEYVALLGPNGAGKTTLIEMIEGIQKPDTGSIRILGMNWKDHTESFIMQLASLYKKQSSLIKLPLKKPLPCLEVFMDWIKQGLNGYLTW